MPSEKTKAISPTEKGKYRNAPISFYRPKQLSFFHLIQQGEKSMQGSFVVVVALNPTDNYGPVRVT